MGHVRRFLPSWSSRSIRSSQSLHICIRPACHNEGSKAHIHPQPHKAHMASTSNTTARISRGIDPGKTGDLSAARQAAAVHAAEARVAAKRASAPGHMNGKPGSAGDEGAATAKPTRRSARVARSQHVRKKSAAMLASRAPAVPTARAFARRRGEGLLAERG